MPSHIMTSMEAREQFLSAYDEFADAIFRHCYFRIGERETAKNIAQEAFTRTWEYLAKGNPIENIRAFLYRVSNNLIVDEFRKKHPVSLDALEDETGLQLKSDGQETIRRIAEGRETLRILQKLDAGYREVVTMRFIDDLPPREIAEILGENVGTVSVRIYRGLRKLQLLIEHGETNEAI